VVGNKYIPTNFSLLYVVQQLFMFNKLWFYCSTHVSSNIFTAFHLLPAFAEIFESTVREATNVDLFHAILPPKS